MSAMLTNRDSELVEKLAEEAAEVIQAAMKVARFGWNGRYDGGISNREQLEVEVGDLNAVVRMAVEAGILSSTNFEAHARSHYAKLKSSRYMLHQQESQCRTGNEPGTELEALYRVLERADMASLVEHFRDAISKLVPKSGATLATGLYGMPARPDAFQLAGIRGTLSGWSDEGCGATFATGLYGMPVRPDAFQLAGIRRTLSGLDGYVPGRTWEKRCPNGHVSPGWSDEGCATCENST